MLTERSSIKSCLAEYLQQRLGGLTDLGASPVSNGNYNFYTILAIELDTAGVSASELHSVTKTLTNIPEPHIVALHGAYRYLQLTSDPLCQLNYAQLAIVRQTILLAIATEYGITLSSICEICDSLQKTEQFHPTRVQVKRVVQVYLDLGVIRRLPTATQRYCIA